MNTLIDKEINKKIYEGDLFVLSNVIKKYNKNVVLDIDYLKIRKNKVYLIVGDNGSGKSTLIKCMLGLLKYEGNILRLVDRVSYLPEKVKSISNMKAKKFLELVKIKDDDSKIDIIKELCAFLDFDYNMEIDSLSKGNLQKMYIILTLMNNNEMYIFDEPLNGLDDNSQDKFFYLLKTLKNNKKTIIITTHYKHYYQGLYDYVLTMNNGRIS